MTRSTNAVIFSFLLASPTTKAAYAQSVDLPSLYRRAAPAVAVVIATDANMQPLAYGTGFFVDDKGGLITNYHVIEGAQALAVKRQGSDEPLLVNSVLAVDTVRDLAFLKVPVTGESLPLSLTVVRPTVGERIAAIGNPMGLESTVSEGIVSGIRELQGHELYQITAPISPGSSGGPVLNMRGEVLGVATSTLREGQNLNFAVPSTYVDRLVKSVSAPKSVAQATRAKLVRPDLGPEGAGAAVLRVVDVHEEFGAMGGNWSAVLFNGSQAAVARVLIRAICWKKGLDVPIGYFDVTVADSGAYTPSVPPGLSQSFSFYCRAGTTRTEFRVLDYRILH